MARRGISFLLALLVALSVVPSVGPAVAAGTALYVSPSGSDSASGSQSAPFRTIGKAASVATAGTTVYVAPGTYAERVHVKGSGTSSSPVRFLAQSGGRVVVADGFYVSGSYNTVEGFEVYPATRTGSGIRNADGSYADGVIQLRGSNNVARGNYVHDTTGACKYAIMTTGANNTVESNRILNVYKGHLYAEGTGVVVRNNDSRVDAAFINSKPSNWGATGIEIHETSGMLVEGNRFEGARDGNLIHVTRVVSNITFRRNVIIQPGRRASSTTHTQTFGFYKTAQNIVIDGNIISAKPYPSGHVAGFTHFFFGTADASGDFRNLTFTNNVMLGGIDGSYMIQFKGADRLTGLRFDNNLVNVGSTVTSNPGWRLPTANTGVYSTNNIVVRGSLKGTRDYNVYTGSKPADEGSHSKVATPRFVNGDTSSVTDYGVKADWTPASGSPTIDAGTSAGTPSRDRLSRTRVDDTSVANTGGGTYTYYDIGPAEKNGTTTNPAPTPAPTPAPAPAPAPTGGLHVSTSGSDSNAGSASAPFRTIGKAAAAAKAGDTVYLHGGTYSERVVFAGAGTATSPITFKPFGDGTVVISRGFEVRGSYNRIYDVTVTPGETSASAAGAGQVLVTGNRNLIDGLTHYDTSWVAADVAALAFYGSYNTVKDVDLHHSGSIRFFGRGAGRAAGTGEHNTVIGGSVRYTREKNVLMQADHSTIEGLDLQYPGQRSGGDSADGVAINGDNVTMRNCIVRNVFQTRPLSEQHPDAIIWWNDGNDLLLEGNIIGSSASSTYAGAKIWDQGHLMWSSKRAGMTSHRVTIRNNVFLGTEGTYAMNGSTGNIAGQMSGWKVIGNTFVSGKNPENGNNGNMVRGASFQEISGWTVANNYFGGRGFDIGTVPSGCVLDYNAYLNYAPHSSSAHSIRVTDPGFVLADTSATRQYGVTGDWHPSSTSPLLGKGTALSALATDKGGATRPTPPAIGAFELVAPVVPVGMTGTMVVNSDRLTTSRTAATVNSSVTGATEMRIDLGSGWQSWMPYAATQAITLPSGDGTKTITVEYRNTSGTTLVLSDTCVLDTVAPSGTFVLAGGATTVTSVQVTGNSSVVGARDMRFDVGAGYSAWEPYQSQKTLTLSAGDGTKTVTAQYRDAAGNLITRVDTVTLDATP